MILFPSFIWNAKDTADSFLTTDKVYRHQHQCTLLNDINLACCQSHSFRGPSMQCYQQQKHPFARWCKSAGGTHWICWYLVSGKEAKLYSIGIWLAFKYLSMVWRQFTKLSVTWQHKRQFEADYNWEINKKSGIHSKFYYWGRATSILILIMKKSKCISHTNSIVIYHTMNICCHQLYCFESHGIKGQRYGRQASQVKGSVEIFIVSYIQHCHLGKV